VNKYSKEMTTVASIAALDLLIEMHKSTTSHPSMQGATTHQIISLVRARLATIENEPEVLETFYKRNY